MESQHASANLIEGIGFSVATNVHPSVLFKVGVECNSINDVIENEEFFQLTFRIMAGSIIGSDSQESTRPAVATLVYMNQQVFCAGQSRHSHRL